MQSSFIEPLWVKSTTLPVREFFFNVQEAVSSPVALSLKLQSFILTGGKDLFIKSYLKKPQKYSQKVSYWK
jgi:hypothetical protein